MTHVEEIAFIRMVQEFRSPILDQFFALIDYFDRLEFFMVLIPIIWLWYGWKEGLRLFCILFLSSLVNYLLKQFFLSPRPFQLDPTLGIIQVSGLGFPSGAGQTVILISGLLIKRWENSWRWFLAAIYIALVSFSRIYLGIHFPTDLLGGWFVGCMLVGVYFYFFPYFERKLSQNNGLIVFLFSQFVLLPSVLLMNTSSALCFAGVALGLGVGILCVQKYQLLLPNPVNAKEYVLRAILGVLGTFTCYGLTLLYPLPDTKFLVFLRFSVMGLWVSLGNLILCRNLLRKSQTTYQRLK